MEGINVRAKYFLECRICAEEHTKAGGQYGDFLDKKARTATFVTEDDHLAVGCLVHKVIIRVFEVSPDAFGMPTEAEKFEGAVYSESGLIAPKIGHC